MDKATDKSRLVCISGNLPPRILSSVKELHRKVRITVPRSGSTLYVGDTCNDGRPIIESWKYKEALRLGIPIVTLSTGTDESKSDKKSESEKAIGWAEKYRPRTLSEVIGHRSEIAGLRSWLEGWSSGRPDKRAVIITGPPGIGKTTIVHLLAKEAGYAVTEYNASDTRSVSALRGAFTLGVRRLRREVIVMDEVDGLSERGGVVEVATIIKKTVVPIFCIANERSPKLKPLMAVCAEMRFSRPLRSTIATGLQRIIRAEGLVGMNQSDLEGLCERNGNDIRAVIHQLEFYHPSTNGIDGVSSTGGDKDATHRMEPFSVVRRLFSNKSLSWNDATDLVFVDHHMIPLMVQEAYVHAGQDDMEAIADAADTLSHGDVMTRRVYQTQDWGLIPHALAQPIMAAKQVPGGAPFQVFPQLLGKMSKQRKQVRQMGEIGRRVTGRDGKTMRLDYAAPLRHILSDRFARDTAPFQETIMFMDGIGITRDDWWDGLDETACDPSRDIPTTIRSAFTRAWNKCHDSGSGSGDGFHQVVRKCKNGKKAVKAVKAVKTVKEEKEDEKGEETEEEEEEDEEWENSF